jgi:hypothetical protein
MEYGETSSTLLTPLASFTPLARLASFFPTDTMKKLLPLTSILLLFALSGHAEIRRLQMKIFGMD